MVPQSGRPILIRGTASFSKHTLLNCEGWGPDFGALASTFSGNRFQNFWLGCHAGRPPVAALRRRNQGTSNQTRSLRSRLDPPLTTRRLIASWVSTQS